MSEIISSTEALSPNRLTQLLREKNPATANVTDIRHEAVGNGLLGDTSHFAIAYDDVGAKGPASLIGKFSPAFAFPEKSRF